MGFRSPSPLLIFILFLFLPAIAPTFSRPPSPKNVQTALRTKWSATPLLLEVGLVTPISFFVFFSFQRNQIIHSIYLISYCCQTEVFFNETSFSVPNICIKFYSLTHSSNAQITELDPLRAGESLKSPGGKCCWVDTGHNLFFEVSEFLSWLEIDDKFPVRSMASEYEDYVFANSERDYGNKLLMELATAIGRKEMDC